MEENLNQSNDTLHVRKTEVEASAVLPMDGQGPAIRVVMNPHDLRHFQRMKQEQKMQETDDQEHGISANNNTAPHHAFHMRRRFGRDFPLCAFQRPGFTENQTPAPTPSGDSSMMTEDGGQNSANRHNHWHMHTKWSASFEPSTKPGPTTPNSSPNDKCEKHDCAAFGDMLRAMKFREHRRRAHAWHMAHAMHQNMHNGHPQGMPGNPTGTTPPRGFPQGGCIPPFFHGMPMFHHNMMGPRGPHRHMPPMGPPFGPACRNQAPAPPCMHGKPMHPAMQALLRKFKAFQIAKNQQQKESDSSDQESPQATTASESSDSETETNTQETPQMNRKKEHLTAPDFVRKWFALPMQAKFHLRMLKGCSRKHGDSTEVPLPQFAIDWFALPEKQKQQWRKVFCVKSPLKCKMAGRAHCRKLKRLRPQVLPTSSIFPCPAVETNASPMPVANEAESTPVHQEPSEIPCFAQKWFELPLKQKRSFRLRYQLQTTQDTRDGSVTSSDEDGNSESLPRFVRTWLTLSMEERRRMRKQYITKHGNQAAFWKRLQQMRKHAQPQFYEYPWQPMAFWHMMPPMP